MDLVCPSCGAASKVADAMIPRGGGSVPCPSCQQPITAGLPDLELDLTDAAPPALPAPAAQPPPMEIGLALDERPAATEPLLASAEPVVEEVVELAPMPEPARVEAAPVQTPVFGSAPVVAAPPQTAPQSHAAKRPLASAGHAAKGEEKPAAGVTRPEPAGKPSSVRVGAGIRVEESSPWRLYGAVGGTALLAIAAVVLVSVVRSRPPPPPEMPNPLKGRVAEWQARGYKPTVPTVDGGVQTARAGLMSGTDRGLRQALEAARSALILDPEAAPAIAVYAAVLAEWPDRVEPDALDEALGAITSSIGDDPDSIYRGDLEEARAWLLMRTERFEAARQAAAKAQVAKPNVVSIRMLQGVSRIPTRPAEAVTELEALARLPDAPKRLPFWLGEAQLRAGHVTRALATWNASLKGGDEDVAVLRRLARLSADIGEHSDAAGRLQKIVDAGWAGVEDRLLLARLLARVKMNPSSALEVLDLGLKETGLTPTNRARFLAEKVAVAVTARTEVVTAALVSEWLDSALDLAPDLPELLYVAGLADEKSGAVDNAINSLEAATELVPERPEVAARLALLLKDDAKAALQVLDVAAREAAQYVPLHLIRAAIALQSGDAAAASTAIRRGRDFDPERWGRDHLLDAFVDAPAAHLNVARLLSQASKKSDNAMVITAVGMAYYFADDLKKADATLAKALKSDAEDVGARLYRAVIGLRKKRTAAAKKDLQVALRADSQHLVVRLYQAKLLEEMHKPAEAERIYRDLLDKNPLDGGARVGLAQALWARGAKEASRDEATKVLSMRPGDHEALRFLVLAERKPAGKKRP
jgi:predicted Zn finger-like uncharacterized protein